MQDILAGLDWQGDAVAVLGLRYRWTAGRVTIDARDLGPAPDRAGAEALIRPDAAARVLAALAPAARAALLGVARVRHNKRGSHYRVLGQGHLQTGAPLADDAALVIYRAEEGGALWARSLTEFEDGRFAVDPDFSSENRVPD